MAIELNGQYQTRDGRPVVLFDAKGSWPCEIRGAHTAADGDWEVETWRASDGKFDPSQSSECCFDLIPCPQPDPAQKRRELAERIFTAARCAALEELLVAAEDKLRWTVHPVCQKGLMDKCECDECIDERLRTAIARVRGLKP